MENYKYHLFMDLDGTMIRRQPLEESFFNHRINRDDVELVIDPTPVLHLKGLWTQIIAYVRPGLVEFLTWAMEKFEGRVYIFTASSRETAEGFWNILRDKLPKLPELVIFGADDCVNKCKKVDEIGSFYQNVSTKDLNVLVNKHRDLFPNYATDRFLLIDDRKEFIDDDFTLKSSIIVPAFSPIIKVSRKDHNPENYTILVSDYYYINPSADEWKIIRERSSVDSSFLEKDLKQSIVKKLPTLESIPNPVDAEVEFARTAVVRNTIESDCRYIFSCSKLGALETFFARESVDKYLGKYKPSETYAILEITDQGDLKLIDSHRK